MRVPSSSGLPGPAPTRHQPRSIYVRIDYVDGRYRLSTPHARGWARVARNHHQLAVAIGMAFTEAAVASYSTWQRQRYDLDELTAKDDPTEPPRRKTTRRPVTGEAISYGKGRVSRPDTTHPAQWALNADGTYTSPAGYVYRPGTARFARLEAKRAKLNLPIRPQEAS